MLRTRKVVISPDWQALLREQNLDNIQSVYDFNGGEAVTQAPTTEVRRIILKSGADERTVYLKKYWANARQLWSGALRGTLLGRSKVRREFENLAWLRQAGLDAPAPIAYGEERAGGWLVRSFLLSEGVRNALPLDVFIRQLSESPADERRRRRIELIERLADYTRRMHENHFVHHDYFWRNIILRGASLNHFFLIDAHKGRRWAPWRERPGRAKDLAALDAAATEYFSRSERMRFFLRYAGTPRLAEAGKDLIRLALKFAEPQRERQLRRVREGRRRQQ